MPHVKRSIRPGDVYGRLAVVEELDKVGHHRRFRLRCSCDAANEVVVFMTNLGTTKSCGCYRREVVTVHGRVRHPLYYVFKNMMNRCYRSNDKSYQHYGGRGIKVCQQWHDASIFISWCLANGWRPGLEIDRENNNGDYEPNNCAFKTPKANSRNRRTNVIVSVAGVDYVLAHAVELFAKVDYGTVLARLRRGWDAERALTTPLRADMAA